MTQQALFLDRDGVINVDLGYVHKPEDIKFIDGVFDLGRAAVAMDYLLVVVTNQSGIGRGLFSESEFWDLMNWMQRRFEEEKCPLTSIYFCPSHPIYGIGRYRQESWFRKPNPGMILAAQDKWSIDLDRSILIGDKLSDIEAGIAAGVGLNLLFKSTKGPEVITNEGFFVIHSLAESINFLPKW